MNKYKEKSLDLIRYGLKNSLIERRKSMNWIKLQGKTRKICIFCAGDTGKKVATYLANNDIEIFCFADNDVSKCGKEIQGKPCLSLDELSLKKDEFIVIIASVYIVDVWMQLKSLGFKYLLSCYEIQWLSNNYVVEMKSDVVEQRITDVFDILSDEQSKEIVYKKICSLTKYKNRFNFKFTFEDVCSNQQYFPSDIHLENKRGVFVDCGAYVGDTLEAVHSFIDWTRQGYVGYELDKANYQILEKYIQSTPTAVRNQLEIFNLGVGKNNMPVHYDSNDMETKFEVQSNSNQVVNGRLVTLDSSLLNKRVWYIKMDIEGSEMDALQGAEELIKMQKPVLGICIYHKFSDLWNIPLYIKSLVPEYRIYIRHHTDIHLETVCYATL